jgi:hypothetical protein
VTHPDTSIKKLTGLLRRLRKGSDAPPAAGETPDLGEPVLSQLVLSMLMWEASSGQARSALRRVRDSVVDLNELRVCVPDEIETMLGERYPLAGERALRLRSVLHEVFRRQHTMSLAHLADLGKREARVYLETLPGMTSYAAARVVVATLGGHAVPVDDRLRDLLAGEGAVPRTMRVEEAGSWIEHHVKAEDALGTHLLLQAWSDEAGRPPRQERQPKEHEAPTAPPAPASAGREPARPDAPPRRKSKARTGG